ncbi:hypothetical protein EYF80_015160 [Liparis tanakae]|uniref:Uncharacterized protein n=1 Tax=Liparis tanakae TaxID=230148 RepID=A0A4Z2IBY0_9TELE|nr:hypothetical protein EYF80_015160 [Liparis tanakae]
MRVLSLSVASDALFTAPTRLSISRRLAAYTSPSSGRRLVAESSEARGGARGTCIGRPTVEEQPPCTLLFNLKGTTENNNTRPVRMAARDGEQVEAGEWKSVNLEDIRILSERLE